MIADYISDSIDEALKTYYKSDEYLQPRRIINEKVAAIRSALPEPMRREMNDMLNMMDNASAELNAESVEKAYNIGVIDGIRLRDMVISR